MSKIKKIFGIKPSERALVPNGLRGLGVEGGKGIFDGYFNQILFETQADHVIETEANVKLADDPKGTCYYNSTATEFQDADDATVTFVDGDRILWRGLDVITASIDISTIDHLEHIMWQGFTIPLLTYDLDLGENQRGEIDITGTGSLTVLGSDGLRVKSSGNNVITQKGDITVNNILNTTGRKNAAINGDMSIFQRGVTFDSTTTPLNSDDTYLADRWLLLSDGNDIVDVTQENGGGISGNDDYIRLDVETVSKKFGILQVIEGKNCKNLIGNLASLAFEAKVTDATKLSDIRAVVISWDGTSDLVTSDIISAWNAEGVRPTLVANWTEENIDSNLGVTTSWGKYKIEGIQIDTVSSANIGVFIYQNDVATNDTTGIFLEITKVQLESGAVATGFEQRSYGLELELCNRYYYRITPGNTGRYGTGLNSSTTVAKHYIMFPVKMRVGVSALEQTGTAADYSDLNANGTTHTSSSVPTLGIGGIYSAVITFTGGASLVLGYANMAFSSSAGSYLGFSAEL